MKKQLQHIIEQEPWGIRACVANEALDYYCPKAFFYDLLNHGCAGCTVSSLIYFCNTHPFFDKHYDEIEEIREEYENSIGEPLRIDGDLKNFLAWFAFEEVTYQMANELDLDI